MEAPGLPTPTKMKRVSSAGKMIASIFWDSQGIIKADYLDGRTINGAYYAEELKWLGQEIVKKRRGKSTQGVLFLQETASDHTSPVAMAGVTKCSFEVLPHSYLFPNLKTNLHGRNFGSNEGIIDAVDEYLGDQEEGFYFEGKSKLEQCWRKCIEAKRDYY